MSQDYSYLDSLDRKLDDLQKQACCRLDNTIVAAGAGSGKTQVLATRFAWLVMSCDISASKILTLTFTKKAAAEMYERIYKTLSTFAANPDIPQKERNNARRALDEFSETHIQTLDSYCNSIVRQCANRYGISPDFGEGDELDIEQLALSYVFNHKDEEEIKAFSEVGEYQKFAKDYFASPVSEYTTIANYEGFFTDKIPVQKQILAEEWNKSVEKITEISSTIEGYLNEIDKEYPDVTYLRNLVEPGNVPESYIIKDSEKIGTDELDGTAMMLCADWILALSDSKRAYNKKNDKDKLVKELYTYIKGETKKKSELQDFIIKFEVIYNQIQKWPVTEKLLYRIEEFSKFVNTQKRISGSLSFGDITDMALKILMEQKDIRTQEKNAYSKIMIDEFQDNNGKNRDLLFLLSEKNDVFTEFPKGSNLKINEVLKDKLETQKLYFVGDEKQSIYKFRGADVSVFNELSSDLKTEPLHMSNNYRSDNSLLSSFNQFFGGFEEGNPESETEEGKQKSVFERKSSYSYEATFPDKAKAQQVDRKTHKIIPLEPITKDNVKVHVCMYNADLKPKDEHGNEIQEKALSGDEQEAFYIAESIRQKYDESQGKLNYSAFAILDKSRTGRHQVVKWLNKFGIPFTVDSQSHIFEEAPVNDIYNYLRVCVYPSDAAAFAALLTSPFVNLNQNAVEIVLASLKPQDKNEGYTAFELNEKLEKALSKYPQELNKYKKAVSSFIQNRQNFLGQKITDSIAQLWQEQSYYFETLTDTKANLLAEQFDLLFEVARTCDEDSKSLAWFVDELDQIRENEKRAYGNKEETEIDIGEISYPLEQTDAVRILTIHKSKGLEFPIVYIMGTAKGCKLSDGKGNYYNEEVNFCVQENKTKKNIIYIHFKEDEDARILAEFKRVIYVAVTRAKKECFIVGSWPQKEAGKAFVTEEIITHYYPDADPDLKKEPESGYDVFTYMENAPFDYLYIKPQTFKAYLSTNYKTGLNKSKTELIEFAKDYYDSSKVVTTPVLESNRKAPSELETEGNPVSAAIAQQACMNGIDEIIQKYIPESEKKDFDVETVQNEKTYSGAASEGSEILENNSFNYADFGTLAHAYLCDFINCRMKEDFTEEDFTGGVKLYKNLKEEDAAKITSCCVELCKRFAQSETGKQVKSTIDAERFIKAEWSFRMYRDNLLYTGSIDLIFENGDGRYTIVDYKTDAAFNNEKYLPQQLCYRTAASKILGVEESKIECKLFYLRYGKEEPLA